MLAQPPHNNCKSRLFLLFSCCIFCSCSDDHGTAPSDQETGQGDYAEDLLGDLQDAHSALDLIVESDGDPGNSISDLDPGDTAADSVDDVHQPDTGEEAPPVFNEISCHGEDWIELLNLSHEPFDLSGWGITDDGILENGLVFSPGSLIEAGQHLVIYSSETAEENTLPFGLNCSDDILWLLNPEGQFKKTITLEPVREDLTWGRIPNGTGPFIETASTPGTNNTLPAPETVVINEVSCHGEDWVELYNLGIESLDLSGYRISDKSDFDSAYILSPDAFLSPGGFLIVTQNSLPAAADPDEADVIDGFEFGIDCSDDTLYLFNPAGGVIDLVLLSPTRADLTHGRLPDGDASFSETLPTPFAPNEAGNQAEIVLNEVNCNGQDWVELVNMGEHTVDLGGWDLDDDEDPGGGYTLPFDSVIAPGEHQVILLESLDESDFPFGIACGLDTTYLFDYKGEPADEAPALDVESHLTVGRLPDSTGDWTPTSPTPAAPNRDPQYSSFIFDSYTVHDFEVTLSFDSYNALRADPYTYVPGQFELMGSDLGAIEVGIRIKGQIGSFVPIDSKPALLIDINRYVDGQLFYGLEKLTLNNMVQDTTGMHEWAAYEIFRNAGVPSSRTGWARLSINGEERGFYLLLESVDDVMLDSWFDSTRHLYEGAYGQDIVDWDELEVDEGNPFDRSDLQLIQEIRDTHADDYDALFEATQELIDWDEISRMTGIELLIGHWDGYASAANNWFFHTTEEGRLSVIPWGTDQTFVWDISYFSGAGDLFDDCQYSEICLDMFLQNLGNTARMITDIELIETVREVGAFVEPYLDADPNFTYTIVAMIDHIEDEQAQIFCMPGIEIDADGDGITNCQGDCNDLDETVFPGPDSVEICADGIDNDCDDRVDEDC